MWSLQSLTLSIQPGEAGYDPYQFLVQFGLCDSVCDSAWQEQAFCDDI